MRILFSPSSPSHADPVGCLRENEKCKFSVDVPRDCPVKQLFLELSRDDGFEMTVPLSAEGGKGDYVTFSCTFALFGCGLYFYCFRFVTEISEFRLYRLGDGDTNMEAGESGRYPAYPPVIPPRRSFRARSCIRFSPTALQYPVNATCRRK